MLDNVHYCPTLHARVAEVKALHQLSGEAKDRLFPIIVWRPWPNALDLGRTADKVGAALNGRRFGLDLDRTKRGASLKGAGQAFDALFDPSNGYANYYAFLREIPGAVPVLRPAPVQLQTQLALIDQLDRGIVVRIEHDASSEMIEVACRIAGEFPDVAVVIDVGWSRDLLGRELWASAIVDQLTEVRPGLELVVSGSSFPDTFAHVHGRGHFPVLERRLHTNLVRRHNAATLIYGDWGSTRPPTIDTVPMRNTPRIDLPFQAEWICYRREDDEGYPELARQLMRDPVWPAELLIWGTYTITCTAEGLPGAIRSPGTAAAARINVHLHRQAYVGAPVVPGDPEEPYVDV